MPKSVNQKMKLLYLWDMLHTDSDEQHGLTMQEILIRLEQKGISAERKSIYDDLAALREWGLDIETRHKGRHSEYALISRDFEMPELLLLVDAVQNSKFLTEKKANALVAKLKKLVSNTEAAELDKRVYVANRIKSQNESVYYNVDRIQSALQKRLKISFDYFSYDLDKQRQVRSKHPDASTNPLGLAYANEQYYLIAYNEWRDSYVHYRLDRMRAVTVLDAPLVASKKVKAFNISEYTSRTFKMHSGLDINATLVFAEYLVNQILDEFGKGVNLYKTAEGKGQAVVAVKQSPAFFGWLAQYGSQIVIKQPQSLADDYRAYLEEIVQQYRSGGTD